MPKTHNTTATSKRTPNKLTDEAHVNEYLQKLEHPLKAEIVAVRGIIMGSSEKLSERVKWAAPSFYYKHDLVTFNHRNQKAVHLVFHHVAITKIQSTLLEGDYKDRRMTYFESMEAVRAKQPELQRIMQELVEMMDNMPGAAA